MPFLSVRLVPPSRTPEVRTDPFVQQRGLQTVAVLCFDKPEMKAQAVTAGAIEMVVMAMRKHREPAPALYACVIRGSVSAPAMPILRQSLCALFVAALDQTLILLPPPLQPLSLPRAANDAGVLEAGCAAIRNVVTVGAGQTRASHAGAIECVVAAMITQAEYSSVQKEGCWALRNLVSRSVENQSKAAFVGGIEAVIAAMGMYMWDLDVQARHLRVRLAALCPQKMKGMLPCAE